MTGFWGQLRFRPNGAQDLAIVFWRPTVDAKPSLCGTASAGWVQQTPGLATSFRGYICGAFPTPGPGGQYCAAYYDQAKDRIATGSLPTP